MKIALAQIEPISGDITNNIKIHLDSIETAAKEKSDAIFFSELSITAYEPSLVSEIALTLDDIRLSVFQKKSDLNDLAIGIGVPLRIGDEIFISLLVFRPHKSVIVYHKQYLHEDEKSFFEAGNQQVFIKIKKEKIALAICYESLKEAHFKNAMDCGATIYLASVAKPEKGIRKAFEHFPIMASKYKTPILMVNSIGNCDDFVAYGNTAIWNRIGDLRLRLDHVQKEILFYNN